jgi:lycopene cyclase domain-containing protein
MSLYLTVMLASFAGPLLLSFDKKVHFYTFWKNVLIAMIPTVLFFLVWDEWFTRMGVWGFSTTYLQGIFVGHLPLEEVLFFLIIPYNILFVHQVQKAYFPDLQLAALSFYFSRIFGVISLVLALFYSHQFYTFSACLLAGIFSFLPIWLKWQYFPRYVLTFLLSLIPFLLVNGILTGMSTPEPIVWYNSDHIIGFRIITIPMEDIFYNYALLTPIVWYFERLEIKR